MIPSKGPIQTKPLKKAHEFLEMDIMMWEITSTGFALPCFTTCRYRTIKEQLNMKVSNFLLSLFCCYCLQSLNAELQGQCWVWTLRHLFGSQLSQKAIQYLREQFWHQAKGEYDKTYRIRPSLDIGTRAHWASKARVLFIPQESKESETDSFYEKIQLLYWLFQRGQTMSFLYDLMKYHQRRNYIIWNL